MDTSTIPEPVSATPLSETPGGSSRTSKKRVRFQTRVTPPLEPIEAEEESLSDNNASEENSDHPSGEPMEDDLLPKERRYESSRAAFQAMFEENPRLLRPSKKPLSARFAFVVARGRYCSLRERKFVNQQSLSLTDKKLTDVKKVVVDSG